MELWGLWLAMALESQGAALGAEGEGHWRSSTSRYYYAAFQAMSAVLLYRGCVPPAGEEAWGHTQTPEMVEFHLEPYIRQRESRRRLASDLGELYKMRIMADYRGRERLEHRVRIARKKANFIVKVARGILPEDKR